MTSSQKPPVRWTHNDIRRAMDPAYPQTGEFALSDSGMLLVLRVLRCSGRPLRGEIIEHDGCRETRLPCGSRAAYARLPDGVKRVVLAATDIRNLVAALENRRVKPGLSRTRNPNEARSRERAAKDLANLVEDRPNDDELKKAALSALAIARLERDKVEYSVSLDGIISVHQMGSALEVFIGGDLMRCYERITGERGTIVRSSKGGEPSGALVEFASTFFRQVGLPVQRETIVRAITRQRSTSSRY
ncbi:MAG: hypothetical protein AB7S74_07405 [Hyphomicrobium sp.]